MDRSHQIVEPGSPYPSCRASEDSDSTPFLNGELKTKRNLKITRSPYLFILDAFLIIILTCLLVFLHKTHITLLGSQGDITGYVPSFRRQLVVFEQHPEFISNHTSEASLVEAQQHWKTLVPRN